MATMTHAESRHLYSWWWDSHSSPKNSKWLQENLTDMDVKVKSMIKLIEEDADSFARRAEMYYKKRPELMKLVEEFYRAYRALAERYDHATGALRQAHRTMAEAFPNQTPFALTDDSPSGSSTPEGEPHTPEMPPPIRAFVEPDDLQMGALSQSSHFHAIKRNGAYSEENDTLNSKRGLKQVNEMFAFGEATGQSKFTEGKVRKGLNFHEEEGKIRESKIHDGSTDIQKNEKGDKHHAYEKTKVLQCEVSQLSSENQNLKMQIKSEQDCVTKCENEIRRLQESLSKSEAAKDIALLECQKLLEKVSNLEVEISRIGEDNSKLNNEMVIKLVRLESAEGQCRLLETEKGALEMELQDLSQQANEQQQELQQKQDEIDKLKCSLKEEHNRYTQAEAAHQSLEKLHSQSLEKLSIAASELQNGVERLKDMELRNCSLEENIQQLKEANSNLNKELKLKEEELKKLNISMQDEHLLSVKTEKALQYMEKLHSQSQEEIRILTLDIHNKVDMLEDMGLKRQQLGEEVQQLNEKNGNLNEQILSSALTIKNLQEEVLSLQKALERLDNEVEHHLHENKALQQELHCVQEEIADLDLKHQCVLEQIEEVGLNKDSFQVSVRELQDGNLELKELCRKHEDEKAVLMNKLENMEKVSEKNVLLEISLSNATVELEGLREKVNTLEECCESSNRKISHLTEEKSSLACQLESVMHNTEKLSETNTFLENSVSDANVELEGLREKLKSLEESSESLYNENSNLWSEKFLLTSQMESLGTTLENVNKSNAELENKHCYLEREKESTLILLGELQNQLKLEQQEHEAFVLSSNTQLATLKDQISLLEEESQSKDKVLEALMHKLLNWEMQTFILQKCLLNSQEWSQRNLASARQTEKFLSDQISLLQQEHLSLVLSSNSQLATLAGKISLVQQESQSKDKELKALQHKLLNCELQVIELQNLLKLEQHEHEAFVLSSNTQLATLKDQMGLLEEESQNKDKELKGLLHKLLNWEMQTFILQKCLLDSQEWSQKNLASARHTEKLLSDHIRLLHQEHRSLVLSSNSQLATLAGQISLVQQESQSKDKELEALQHELSNCELRVIELQNLLKLEQYEHEAFVLFSNTQLGTLKDQISLLEEESQNKDKELGALQHKALNWEMWAFILQSCLLDSKEWTWKHLASTRHTEKLLSDEIRVLQQEHQAFVLLRNSQFATLAGQISLIQQEGQTKDKELKGLHHKLLNHELQAFILQKCLLDSKLLSQKHLASSRHVEKLLTDVKQESIGQKKMIEYISENYKKLQEGIQMVLALAGVKDSCESDGTPDESHYQHILDKIKEVQNFISDTIDENNFLFLEQSVIITLLQQLGLDLSILKLENNVLGQEYKIGTRQLLALKSEKLELLQINENLRQVIHAGCLREDKLKIETDILGKQLSDLHESHKESQAKICILLEENCSLTNEISGLRDKIQMLEEENCVIFAEALNLSCLSLIFEHFGSERAMDLKNCSTDMDSLYRANNVLGNELAEMVQKIELIEAENVLLKSFAIKLDDCQGRLLMLQDDLNMASSVRRQLNHQIDQLGCQIETGKSLLIQRDLELMEANKKVEETENEKIYLYKDLEVVKMEFDEITGVRKELEKKIHMLMDDNLQKDNKISHIHEENQMLNAVIQNLRNGLVGLRASKEHVTSELTYEIKLYEEEVARLWSDNHISTVHVEIFEEKMLELIGECESLEISAIIERKILEEQIASNYTYTDQLNQKLDSLERESRTMKDQSNAYLSLVLSLQNSIASLENQTLSLMEDHEMNHDSAKDSSLARHEHVKSFQQPSMHIVELDGVLKLQKLHARIQELQKVLMEHCNILTRVSDADAKSSAAEMEIVVSKPERTLDEEEIQLKENTITSLEAEVQDPGKNVELQPDGAESSRVGYGPMVKDIQLDQSSFDAGSGLYKKVSVEDVETDDQMLKLWETAESDYNNEMLGPSSITTADDIICHQIEAVKEEKSKYPSESVAEKELGVDKLGVPKKVFPHQQWNTGILECLASDAQRLLILQNSVQELKKQLEKAEKIDTDTSTNMKYDTMKGQLKRAEEAISGLVDINLNLTKKAEDCSTSFDSNAGEQEGVRNQQKEKVSDHPQRGLEKIGRLELELQKIQYILLKLDEERENRIRAAQGRSRVILRDYLYGQREGNRRKRGHFCGCLRPKTFGD